MENKCCNISVAELQDGYRLEVTGQDVKERCKTILEKCCSGDKMNNCGQTLGDLGKEKKCC